MKRQEALGILQELADSYPNSKWVDDETLVVHSGAIGDISGFAVQKIMGDTWAIWVVAQIKAHPSLLKSSGFAGFVEQKGKKLEKDFGFEVSMSNGEITLIDTNPLNSSTPDALREALDAVSGYSYQILSEAANRFLSTT